jgi:hypothetical protein
MVWSVSASFRQFWVDRLDRTINGVNYDFDAAATWLVAIYNNAITPDMTVSAANSAYNAGQWALANEVSDASGWPAGGRTLVNNDVTATAAGWAWDADDTTSAAAWTGTGYGNLIYSGPAAAPVVDQGLSFHYWGGAFTWTAGFVTILWPSGGIITCDTQP